MAFNATVSYTATTVANTVLSVTFGTTDAASVNHPTRYEYVTVENSGTVILYLTTNGVAPTVGGVDTFVVMPGESAEFANMLPLWDPAAGDIQSAGTDATGEEIWGGTANPGTNVQVISLTATTFTVSGQ